MENITSEFVNQDANGQINFDGWAKVEIMGHRVAIGRVTTQHIGAAAFLRIVTPEIPATRYTLEKSAWIDGSLYGPGTVVETFRERREILVGTGSIYAITPMSEEQATQHAAANTRVIEAKLQGMLASASNQAEEDEEDEEDKGDDEVGE